MSTEANSPKTTATAAVAEEKVGEEGIATENDSKKRSVEETTDTTTTTTPNSASADTATTKKPCISSRSRVILDKADQVGLKAGDRIEVQWQLGDDEDDTGADNNNGDSPSFRWWPATLLEHDGRTVAVDDDGKEAVAIRVIDYDPYPEGGFPERSMDSVVFIGQGSLVDMTTEERMVYRKEGEHFDDDEQPIVLLNNNEMEEYINNIMASLVEKHSDKFQNLSAAQQALMAERLNSGKNKFLEMLSQNVKDGINRVVTAEKMQELLALAVSK